MILLAFWLIQDADHRHGCAAITAIPWYVLLTTSSATGASGLLGSAVYTAFKKSSDEHIILGLAHSRSTEELTKLDLLDYAETERVFNEFKPDCEYRKCIQAIQSSLNDARMEKGSFIALLSGDRTLLRRCASSSMVGTQISHAAAGPRRNSQGGYTNSICRLTKKNHCCIAQRGPSGLSGKAIQVTEGDVDLYLHRCVEMSIRS